MGDSTGVAFSSQIHGGTEEAYQGCGNGAAGMFFPL